MGHPPPPRDVWLDDRVRVGPSTIHGEGLLTTHAVAAGTVVLRLGGRLVDSAALNRLVAAADREPEVPFVDSTTVYEDLHLVLPSGSAVHFQPQL